MKTVTLEEAKLHLDTLIESANPGEPIEIVREGIKVGELRKAAPSSRTSADGRLVGQAFLDRLDEIARGNRLEGVSILELRDEGRRQ